MNTLNIESLEQRAHVANPQSFNLARVLTMGSFADSLGLWTDNELEDNEVRKREKEEGCRGIWEQVL